MLWDPLEVFWRLHVNASKWCHKQCLFKLRVGGTIGSAGGASWLITQSCFWGWAMEGMEWRKIRCWGRCMAGPGCGPSAIVVRVSSSRVSWFLGAPHYLWCAIQVFLWWSIWIWLPSSVAWSGLITAGKSAEHFFFSGWFWNWEVLDEDL